MSISLWLWSVLIEVNQSLFFLDTISLNDEDGVVPVKIKNERDVKHQEDSCQSSLRPGQYIAGQIHPLLLVE